MDELVPILLVIGGIIWAVYAVLTALQFGFLFASAALGHPVILLFTMMCFGILGQAFRYPERKSPESLLFNTSMSVRKWTMMITGAYLLAISAYGALVL